MPPNEAMATMLDLPRELYLMICADLSTKDLINLAQMSRDHYLAVQQSLFVNVSLSSYSSLVKLVGTLTKDPVVSHVTSRQNLQWDRLSDAELRERDIRKIHLTLNSEKDGSRITGVLLSHLIGIIARKCDTVQISLTFLGLTEKLLKELNFVTMPNVTRLTMFVPMSLESELGNNRARGISTLANPLRPYIWTFSFSGSLFPNLRAVYMNNLVDCAKNLPTSMANGFRLAGQYRPRRRISSLLDENEAFHGLVGIKEIILEYNTFLDADVLKRLFVSEIVPQQLTRLEIVNCPALHPIRDLEALATLLQRGLQFLQFLKLHLTGHFDGHHGFDSAYVSKIHSHPEHHLCNVVREMGQKIMGLDLAVPYACPDMFARSSTRQDPGNISDLELPDIPETPVKTLPRRLIAAGYRYRRLIFNEFCNETDDWETMVSLAFDQKLKTSWELLFDDHDPKAVWLVSGCAPVAFSVERAMTNSFEAG